MFLIQTQMQIIFTLLKKFICKILLHRIKVMFFFSLHSFYFLFLFYFFISWRLITLQYCSGFCHTLTRIIHGFTRIPHSNPLSHIPLRPIPLGLPSTPGPSTCLMHVFLFGNCAQEKSKTISNSMFFPNTYILSHKTVMRWLQKPFFPISQLAKRVSVSSFPEVNSNSMTHRQSQD